MSVPSIVAGVLDPVLATEPDREFLVTRSGRWSYRDIDRLADAAADALAGLGVAAGDRVAVSLPNDLDVVVAFHGAMRLGAVWVGINRALAPPERQYILDDSGSCLLLCESGALGGICGVPTVTTDRWHELLTAPDPRSRASHVDPFAPAAIAYTSGTTGYPKGVVHSQYNLLLPGCVLAASRGWGPDLRKGDCFPLTILNLQVLTSLAVAQAGGCSVIMDRIDAEGVAEWIRREKVTVWNGPPALLHSMAVLDSVRPADLDSLEEAWSGGADCPEAMRTAFEAKFGLPVITTYGLTEAPTVVTIDDRSGGHVAGASGCPLPHLRLCIVDDDGDELAVGETGEICVASTGDGAWVGAYRPMLGYWNRDDASAVTLRGGMLHTGDVGRVDASGALSVLDRKNLMMIRGGANVYPAEVERVVQQLEAVQCCVAFGVPDERLGERVIAAIELRHGLEVTAEELTAHCRANLARYKVPEHFVFVDSFVRNAMGKVQRRDVVEEYLRSR